MATLTFKRKIVINRPLGETFAYVSDLENLPEWASVAVSAKKTPPGAMQPGTSVRCTTRFLGKFLDIVFVVVEYEQNRSFTLKSVSGATSCLFTYQFEQGEDEGTIIAQEAMLTIIAGVMSLPEPVIGNALRRLLEYDLLTLKDLLEIRATPQDQLT